MTRDNTTTVRTVLLPELVEYITSYLGDPKDFTSLTLINKHWYECLIALLRPLRLICTQYQLEFTPATLATSSHIFLSKPITHFVKKIFQTAEVFELTLPLYSRTTSKNMATDLLNPGSPLFKEIVCNLGQLDNTRPLITTIHRLMPYFCMLHLIIMACYVLLEAFHLFFYKRDVPQTFQLIATASLPFLWRLTEKYPAVRLFVKNFGIGVCVIHLQKIYEMKATLFVTLMAYHEWRSLTKPALPRYSAKENTIPFHEMCNFFRWRKDETVSGSVKTHHSHKPLPMFK